MNTILPARSARRVNRHRIDAAADRLHRECLKAAILCAGLGLLAYLVGLLFL